MTEPEQPPASKIDWLLIGVLLLLVLPLRLWLLHNTEVAARDSITFVQYALEFEHKSWPDILRAHHQHPGYPFLVWLMSLAVRAVDGPATPENMALSTQLVSMAASLLLILPMYWLGRQFFDRKVSFCATLLYQVLPISAQHLSDGISEPAYLLILVSGLLQAVHAVRERSVWRGALCGVFIGLAYLTRPEGVLIFAAWALPTLLWQFRADWRCSWKQLASCATAMALTAMMIGSVYYTVTGSFTNKSSVRKLLGQPEVPGATSLLEAPASARGSQLLFAVSFPRTDSKALRLQRSVWALVQEINHGFHYVAGIPALLGLWWSFGRLRSNPGFWVVAVFTVIHSLTLIALAMSVSYVSDRHVMILVLFGSFFAVVGLQELPRRILAWTKAASADFTWATCWRSAPAWSAVLLVALIAFCLPKATQRLHGNRTGNHAAGVWLHEHVQKGDQISDEYDWSKFFSGLFLKEESVPAHVPTCYIVTTSTKGPSIESPWPTVKRRDDAKVVYTWPDGSDLASARVVVYAQPISDASQKR